METSEYQTNIIETLDKVVAKVETVTMELTCSTLDFESLKGEIKTLYQWIEDFQTSCTENKSDMATVKKTMESLKKKAAEPVAAEPVAAEPIAAEKQPDTADSNQAQDLFSSLELEQNFLNSEETKSTHEGLEQFDVKEEDRPQSYITAFTAMVQAENKSKDMSGVAVSSTVMPANSPLNEKKNESILDSLRNTKANLYGGHLRTIVDKFKTPQTLHDLQQNRPADLKTSMGMNEKFLLSNELFGGSMKEFTEAVNKMNEAENTVSALQIWAHFKQIKEWNEESLAYITFYDLLKKRFPELLQTEA